MGLKDKVDPSSRFLHCSPQSAQYGCVPAAIPPAPPATHPCLPLLSLDTEPLSSQPLPPISLHHQTHRIPFLSLLPPSPSAYYSSLESAEGCGVDCQM